MVALFVITLVWFALVAWNVKFRGYKWEPDDSPRLASWLSFIGPLVWFLFIGVWLWFGYSRL